MNTLKLKYAATILGIIFFIVSCKKSKPPKEKKSVETDKPVITDPVNKLFIPKKLESENLIINLKYLENSAFISEVNSSDAIVLKLLTGTKYRLNVLNTKTTYLLNLFILKKQPIQI